MKYDKRYIEATESRDWSENLKALAAVDVRTVDKSTLVDIESVKIDKSLSDRERVLDYLKQIKNPYCYLYRGTVVKISFCGKESLEDCLIRCLALE